MRGASPLLIPSRHTGFARGRGESARPEFWDSLIMVWCPFLGVEQNSGLRDQSGRGWTTTTAWQSGVAFVYGDGPTHVHFPDTAIENLTGFGLAELQNNFTIIARIRTADHTKTQQICSQLVGVNNCWQFWFDGSGDLQLRRQIGFNRDASVTLSTAYDNTWFSVAARHDFINGGAVFADGGKKGTNANTGALDNTPNNVQIGWFGSSGEDFVGDISALYIYSTPKPDTFIRAVMADWTGVMRLWRRRIMRAQAAVAAFDTPVLGASMTGILGG